MNELKQRIESGFHNQGFMRLIGAELRHVSEGSCEIAVRHRSELTQHHGLYHGGLIATLADVSSGFAAQTLMDDGFEPLTVEFKINFVAKAVGQEVIARPTVKQNGRRLKIFSTEVFSVSDNGETLCAIAIVSIMAVDGAKLKQS